jgi:hypothetical protein
LARKISGDDAEQGGLASTIRAHDADEFAFIDSEGNVVDRDHAREGFYHGVDGQ